MPFSAFPIVWLANVSLIVMSDASGAFSSDPKVVLWAIIKDEKPMVRNRWNQISYHVQDKI